MRLFTLRPGNPYFDDLFKVTSGGEPRIIARMNRQVEDTMTVIKPAPFIILARNVSLNEIDLDYVDQIGLPILRSILSSKTDSNGILGTSWGVGFVQKVGNNGVTTKADLFTKLFEFWQYVVNDYGMKLKQLDNDFVIDDGTDTKKITAFAGDFVYKKNDLQDDILFGYSAFLEHDLLDKDGKPVEIDRILKQTHNKKMTSFESITGKRFADDEVLNKARQWLTDNGHIVTDAEDFTDYEKGLFPKYEEKSRDEDWIRYAQKRK